MDDEPVVPTARGLTRRALLQRGGLAAFAVFSLPGCGTSSAPAGQQGVAVPLDGAKFLSEPELQALRALVDRLIPPDLDAGAAEAGCAEAIDALLGAFGTQPPRIFAGGPFSDRAGAPVNDFAEFLPLDPYEEKAWRLRIEGSPQVKGLQQIYREGLAALGPDFATRDPVSQELLLRTSRDAAVTELVDVAFPHALQFMYGAPEYGGNKDLTGWRFTGFDGDVQPRGWTREEVENPELDGPLGLPLPPGVTLAQIAALSPLASYEASQGILQRAGGRWSGLRAGLAEVLQGKADA